MLYNKNVSTTDKLRVELVLAMQERETRRRDALRYILSIVETESKKNSSFTEKDVIAVLRSEFKKRNDTVSLYQNMENQTEKIVAQIEQEQFEANVLQEFLPPVASRELIREAINTLGLREEKNKGKVIGQVKKHILTTHDLDTLAPDVIAELE